MGGHHTTTGGHHTTFQNRYSCFLFLELGPCKIHKIKSISVHANFNKTLNMFLSINEKITKITVLVAYISI